MDTNSLAAALWDIANTITAFAAVQALGFAYACAKKDVGDIINRRAIKASLTVIILIIGGAQIIAVEWCRSRLCELDLVHCEIYSQAGFARAASILSFTLFAILILYARQIFSQKPFDA